MQKIRTTYTKVTFLERSEGELSQFEYHQPKRWNILCQTSLCDVCTLVLFLETPVFFLSVVFHLFTVWRGFLNFVTVEGFSYEEESIIHPILLNSDSLYQCNCCRKSSWHKRDSHKGEIPGGEAGMAHHVTMTSRVSVSTRPPRGSSWEAGIVSPTGQMIPVQRGM